MGPDKLLERHLHRNGYQVHLIESLHPYPTVCKGRYVAEGCILLPGWYFTTKYNHTWIGPYDDKGWAILAAKEYCQEEESSNRFIVDDLAAWTPESSNGSSQGNQMSTKAELPSPSLMEMLEGSEELNAEINRRALALHKEAFSSIVDELVINPKEQVLLLRVAESIPIHVRTGLVQVLESHGVTGVVFTDGVDIERVSREEATEFFRKLSGLDE